MKSFSQSCFWHLSTLFQVVLLSQYSSPPGHKMSCFLGPYYDPILSIGMQQYQVHDITIVCPCVYLLFYLESPSLESSVKRSLFSDPQSDIFDLSELFCSIQPVLSIGHTQLPSF